MNACKFSHKYVHERTTLKNPNLKHLGKSNKLTLDVG